MKRVFLIGAFSIIGGFAGTGIASMMLTLTVNQMPKSRGTEFLGGSIPLLASGGALGFVAAFLFGHFCSKTERRQLKPKSRRSISVAVAYGVSTPVSPVLFTQFYS